MDLLLHEPLNSVSSSWLPAWPCCLYQVQLGAFPRVQQSHLLALGRAGEASVGR